MSFLFINKILQFNILKTRTAINVKISVFAICVEAILYMLLYNLHVFTFNYPAKLDKIKIYYNKINCVMATWCRVAATHVYQLKPNKGVIYFHFYLCAHVDTLFLGFLYYLKSNRLLYSKRAFTREIYPGMNLVPEWNHPCLWWNVSYCLRVFAEMKFNLGMNWSLSKRLR